MGIDKYSNNEKSKKYYFMLPIGDWSNDGHSKCDWFLVESNMPLENVFKSYFTAKEKLPEEICPANFCNEYGDSEIPQEICQKLVEAGCPKNIISNTIDDSCYPEFLQEIVLWFIMQGNENLKLKIVKKNYAFIDWCLPKHLRKHNECLDSFGYGLFE